MSARTGSLTENAAGSNAAADEQKQPVVLELDERTLAALAAIGDPRMVLEELARAAAGDLRSPHQRRDDTDTNLRAERRLADAYLIAWSAFAARSSPDGAKPSAAGGIVDAARQWQADRPMGAERHSTDDALTDERAETETVLLNQRDANEQLVIATVRAQDLAEEFEEAKNRAEASERVLREVAEFREMFIGILSHDLRNPLNAISMAAATLLGRGRLDAREAESVQKINRACDRITKMITQLLELTRLRMGGGFELDRKPVDLRDVCQPVLEEFGARTEFVPEGDLGGTWDADRLQELLSNLVGNGLEYADPGTNVRVIAQGAGRDVTLEVKNQGAPIPPDIMPFIFDAFRRVKQKHRTKTGNLGLGLYIAKQVVLAHGGELEAECADGWTTFRARLPREVPAP